MWLLIILALLLLASTLQFIEHFTYRKLIKNFSSLISLIVLILSFVSPLLMPIASQWKWHLFSFSGLHLTITLYYDTFTWVMLCLVSFINLVITSFSARYLLSDSNQPRFMGQLFLLTFSVMLLMMSGSLLTAFIGWQFIGLTLYLLLNHYHYDYKANKSAKKKFIINRVGDICFLIAVIIAMQNYGTTNYQVLFQHASSIKSTILVLIFVAIMTKSAQFPFHIWLIDTMEAPTPVSAIMHAGVINAGGFLLARLSPLYDQIPALMLAIVVIGLTTALIGKYFMQTQPDIKKQLAYSTMGQMGYMLLQCGLGCFASAVFHLIAHGFFKAKLFLSSGNNLAHGRFFSIDVNSNKSKSLVVLVSFAITAVFLSLGIYFFLYTKHTIHLSILIWIFISISVFQLIYKSLARCDSIYESLLTVLYIGIIFAVYLTTLKYFSLFMSASVTEIWLPASDWLIVRYIAIIALAILLVFWLISLKYKKELFYKVYAISIYKGNIEFLYRKYLINPMRHVGEIIFMGLQRLPSSARRSLFIFACFLLVLSITYLMFLNSTILLSTQYILISLNIIALFITLLVANRIVNLSQLVIALFLSTLFLANMALCFDSKPMRLIAIYQIINFILPLIGCFMLIKENSQIIKSDSALHNRLPCSHFYISIFLMMLIGIPGTASFISELYLFKHLMQVNFIYLAAFGVCIILLALVVLHTLQLKIFNPNVVSYGIRSLSFKLHTLCLLIIGFNLFSGIYPRLILQALNKVV